MGVVMRIGDVASVPTILLVHEDPAFRELVGLVLRAEGFRVVLGTDGLEAVARWEANRPDLLLLGDRLPVFDAVEVCRRIRQADATPVVIVTPGPDEAAALRAFAAGADDVLARPVGLRELPLRLRAILRRHAGRPSASMPDPAPAIGGVSLDAQMRAVRWGPQAARLTERELEILAALMARPGRVVPYAGLGTDPGSDDPPSRRAIQHHVMRLRRKLRAVAGRAVEIEVVADRGYRLVG
jgi:DNA-binding response OmpR family regulator